MKGGPVGPGAVLVGLDSMQGIQLARILRDRGVEVTGVAADLGYHTTRTNACVQVIEGPTHGEGLVRLLSDLAGRFRDPPVLIPCQDHAVLTVSRERDRLAGGYRILLPDADVVELMMHKEAFIGFAEAIGLRTPTTRYVASAAEARRCSGDFSYPVVLKPRLRTIEWMEATGQKVITVSSRSEFEEACTEYTTVAGVLVAQEWIPGTDEALYSVNACYSADSEPLVTFVARKIRQWPIEAGQSSAGVECRADAVLEEADRAFRAARMQGLAYMEFKQHAGTGEFFVIEPNIGRPTGRSAIAEGGGVELHFTMYCLAAGLPLPDARTQVYVGAKWVHLLRDFLAARQYISRKQLTWRGWLASLRGPKTFALWSARDPLPFAVAVAHAVGARLRRVEHG